MREDNIELSRRFINTENSNDDRILDKEKNECNQKKQSNVKKTKNKNKKQDNRMNHNIISKYAYP